MPSSAGPHSPLQQRLRWNGLQRETADERTVILSSFTANPLEPYLGVALHDVRLPSSVVTGPYDQIAQQFLLEDSETSLARPTLVVVWPRCEDLWRSMPLPLFDDLDRYVAPFVELANVAIAAAARWGSTLVFVLPALCELRPLGVGDAGNELGVAAASERVRAELRATLAGKPGVLVADAEEVIRALGTSQALNPRTLTAVRVPYSQEMFMAVGERIARLVSLSRHGARKVAVVDADNTLWAGVVGEDGVGGVDLLDSGPGEAHREFQRWLVELRRSGTLLALASKNNEADVWSVFERHDMVLSRDHLAASRINWEPKSANLAALAEELSLGLSSFVFIDDSPVEIAEVGANAPGVTTVMMPADVVSWVSDVAQSGALDRLPPTAEDLGRAESYRVETVRNELKSALTASEYRASLEIAVRVFEPQPNDVARTAQLFAKTNQFTIGGPRYTEAEVVALLGDPSVRIRLFDVSDRFGEYGIVGATVVSQGGPGARLDAFVLSCRAMGRGVEEAMVAEACRAAGGRVEVCVVDTGRNVPAQKFFATVSATTGHAAMLEDVRWPVDVRREERV